MNNEIKVLSSTEKQTKFGKPMKALEVFADGENRKVNVFSNVPDFANIRQGSSIMGKMVKNGDYWDIVFENAPTPRGGANSAYKTAQIEKVMDVKRQDISKFQDNKEYSIKLASTFRMAVDCALAERGDENVLDTLEQGIEKWRRYFWESWEVDEKKFNPF